MTISKYGNASAASVSMALGWAAEEGLFNDGDRIIFCSVGAGLTSLRRRPPRLVRAGSPSRPFARDD